MKTPILSALAACFLALPALAQDVAVVSIKLPKEKKPQRVVFEFYEADAPETVANFKRLARRGFYNGIAFHRVFPGQLVQAGDPMSKRKDRTAVGTNGPGYTLVPEIRRKHERGSIGAARLPDRINPARRSNGSQFYVVFGPMPKLDGAYTVFGKVAEGLDVLEAVSSAPSDTNDYPLDRIVIQSVKILPRERAGL